MESNFNIVPYYCALFECVCLQSDKSMHASSLALLQMIKLNSIVSILVLFLDFKLFYKGLTFSTFHIS